MCRREEEGGVLGVGVHARVCVVRVGVAGERSGVVLFWIGRRVRGMWGRVVGLLRCREGRRWWSREWTVGVFEGLGEVAERVHAGYEGAGLGNGGLLLLCAEMRVDEGTGDGARSWGRGGREGSMSAARACMYVRISVVSMGLKSQCVVVGSVCGDW